MQFSSRYVAFSKSALMLVGVLALSACSTLNSGTPEEIVAKRAQAYWDARLKGDSEKTRSFTNEAFRSTIDDKKYARNYMATFAEGAEIRKVKCEVEKCEVLVRLKVNPPIPGRKLGTIDMDAPQTWLLEGGQWNLYQPL